MDNNTTTVRSNNLVLAGGTFQILTGSTHHYWGNISGTGTINVGNQRPDKARNCYHYFYGDISGLDAQSQLTGKSHDLDRFHLPEPADQSKYPA